MTENKAATALTAVDLWQFGRPILACEVGSTAHGTGVGTDDLDVMAIVIPPARAVIGLEPFDCHVYRTAEIREKQRAVRSQPGDLDLTVYSLRKFVGLAKKGNPSILNLFFAPVLDMHPLGQRLRTASGLFVSKEAGYRFVGYMTNQRERMAGTRGQKRIKRPELVEQHGYDTKYAYHVLRLGLQGLEFIRHGKITMPMVEHVCDMLLAVRNGHYPQDRILQWANELEKELVEQIRASSAPHRAADAPIDQLLVDLHEASWKWDPQDRA